MASLVMLLALILLAAESNAQRSACSIRRCVCANRYHRPHTIVVCSVDSITSQDATFKSLPADIEELALICESSSQASVLSAGIFSKFPNLKTLGISDCVINVMRASSFSGLSSLENLAIYGSLLPSLDADTFLYLSAIQGLAIISCKLKRLPDISHLKYLSNLNVSSNILTEIEFQSGTDNITQAGYFNNLLEIDLSYNNIRSMPFGLIARAPHLKWLNLQGLPLTELSIPEYTQLRNLEILLATGSSLVVTDLSGLHTASKIRILALDGSGQPLHFPGLPHLVDLESLTFNNFAITDTIWQQLNSSHLADLTLTNNNLTSINISHLPALQLLDVAGNNISHLGYATFFNQPNLTFFNISHNRIQELPVNIFHENVGLLDLSYNNISSIQSESFSDLRQLIYLDLRSNFISALPYNIFKDLPLLKVLNMNNNTLRFLPNLFYMPGLIVLKISFNQLSSLMPSDLSGLVSLQYLDIKNNRITRILPNLLSQCPQLLQAWFDGNQITSIGTLEAHHNLIFLSLQNNQITDFTTPHPFAGLLKLESLFLSANNLTRLSYRMFPPSLQFLSVDANYLENLPNASLSYFPKLNHVSLSYNKRILSMPSGSVTVFKEDGPKPGFSVWGNVFLCDCHMSYLKVISEDNYFTQPNNNPYPVFYGLEDSFCYSPLDAGAIRPFKDVPLSHFECEYNVTWCDDICHCCSDAPKCECALSCPSECKCYYGGSGLKKFYIHIHCRSQNLEQIPNGIPARTVVLYLDGNNFSHLSRQDFTHLQNAENIYLNSSYIKSADNGTFENITALKSLFLNDNQLTSIDDNFLGRLASVKQIYLHNNLIDTISSEAFSQLSSVETITLHNNRLMFLKAVLKIPHRMSLTLSRNPWSCNCDVSKVLMRTFYEIKASITDNEKLCCSFQESLFLSYQDSRGRTFSETNRNGDFNVHNSDQSKEGNHRNLSLEDYKFTTSNPSSSCLPLSDFSYQNYCRSTGPGAKVLRSTSHPFQPGFIALIVITIMLLMAAVAIVAVLVKRQELQALIYVKLGVRILDKKVRPDKEDGDQKVFDAFISYSSKDEVFVATNLVPLLEDGQYDWFTYRLCVHYRDFPVGRDITETIYRAIQNSSRTILLLSMNFLSSEWCRFEFQTAHHHILREGSHRLIVVILGDVPEEEMDPDLKVHIQSRTYLKYGDRWFWEKLFFAMPSIKGRQVNNGDQRADILQRMEVLAQDEIVDREINLPGQQHNPQDEIVDRKINLPGQQHNPEDEIVDREINLPGQQNNPQDEIVDREINLPGQQHNPQDEIVDRKINLPGQQHNPQDEIVDRKINLPGQKHNPQDEIVDRANKLPGQQHNPQYQIADREINLPGRQHNHKEASVPYLIISPESHGNRDLKDQGGGNTGTQEGGLVNNRMQLSSLVSIGVLKIDDAVKDDLDNSAEDEV